MSFPSDGKPLIYLITKGNADPSNFNTTKKEIIEIIERAAGLGISHIQIREKRLPAGLLYDLACEAAKIAKRSGIKLLINDRADIALAANADGVHLTASSIPANVIRRSFPPGFTIGVSTHSLSEVIAAKEAGADFAVFGPVFETPGKGEATGLSELSRVCENSTPFPVIALGGISETNKNAVLKSGAAGFAAIRYLNDLVSR